MTTDFSHWFILIFYFYAIDLFLYFLETRVYHNFPNEVDAEYCKGRRCAKYNVIYDATMQQIIALINQSTECRQFIKVIFQIYQHNNIYV